MARSLLRVAILALVFAVAAQAEIPHCQQFVQRETVLPGSKTQFDLTQGGSCSSAVSGTITQHPASGSASIAGSKLEFTAPSEGESAVFAVLNVVCGGYTCQKNVIFMVSSSATQQPTEAATPTPALRSCGVDIKSLTKGIWHTGNLAKDSDDCSRPRFDLSEVSSDRITFQASGSEYSAVSSSAGSFVVRGTLTCGNGNKCTKGYVFNVAEPATTTIAPTTTTVAPLPKETDAPVVDNHASCGTPAVLKAQSGGRATGSIARDGLDARCDFATYHKTQSVMALKGLFQLNTRGDVIYQAPQQDIVESTDVLVKCYDRPLCHLTVYLQSYAPLTPQPATQPPAQVGQECPKYYYHAEPSVVLSASLRGQLGEPACSGQRTFTIGDDARDGTLRLHLNGDFTYEAPTTEDIDDFSYTMFCDNRKMCVGRAYLMASNVSHGDETNPPHTGHTAAPVEYKNTRFQTCKGSCTAGAWKVSPIDSSKWDTTPGAAAARADGKPIGGLDVNWEKGTLQIDVYGKIGTLSQRFPTFEKITWNNETKFTAADVAKEAASSSTGFDAQCLAKQATDMGLAAEVWKVESDDLASGTLGPRYRRGRSWYHKFGGAHQDCDTFVDSCKYSPLLTPRAEQPAANGAWSVDINNCDVTWKGVLPYHALRNLKKADGANVWTLTQDRRLQATLYSEAVKPNNWVFPSKGFATSAEEHKLNIKLKEWVGVHKMQTTSSTGSPFTIDAEFFEYNTAEGDRAFGLNMLFYPVAQENERKRFTADRRVRGFRVTKAEWTTPDAVQCPTCTGSGVDCAINAAYDDDSHFVADNLQALTCAGGSNSRIELVKGPMMTDKNCRDENDNFVFGRAGLSAPADCANSFQNLTIRGIARGSGKDNSSHAFDYEGKMLVQLLLANGNRATVSVDISLYVSSLATGGNFDGSVELCRSSPYWPVLDPLGTSLPDDRFHLAPKLPKNEDAFLCVDNLDKSFGPEGWAVASFSLDGYSRENLRVEQFGLRYPGSDDVFFLYNDAEGKATAVPAEAGTSWAETHPFFNFRDITYRLANNSITSPEGPTMSTADFAFALNPGAIALDVDLDLFCIINVLDKDGKVIGRPTLRQRVHVDPLLTAASRYGPARVADVEIETAEDSPYFFFVTAGIIIAVIAVGAAALAKDTDRPLPRWVPKPDSIPGPMSVLGKKKGKKSSPSADTEMEQKQ